MGLVLIRIIFGFIGTLLGYYVSTQLDEQISKVEGMAIGFAVAISIILTELLFWRVALKVIIGGILGFIIGLTSANIIAAPLKLVPLERSIVNFLVLLMNAFFGYMGVTIGIREGEQILRDLYAYYLEHMEEVFVDIPKEEKLNNHRMVLWLYCRDDGQICAYDYEGLFLPQQWTVL